MDPTPSRRALFGAPAALLLLAAPAAGATKARELDGELQAMCSEAMRLDREAEAIEGYSETANQMMRQWFEVADIIAATPAKTPEGLRAKAEIIRHLMAPNVRRWTAGDDDDEAVHDPLVWSLVNDLTGRAA